MAPIDLLALRSGAVSQRSTRTPPRGTMILHRWLERIGGLLPQGRTLPDAVWFRRHRAILVILALQGPALAAFGAFRGYGVQHSATEGTLVALFAVAAWAVRHRRRLSSAVASFGLMNAS